MSGSGGGRMRCKVAGKRTPRPPNTGPVTVPGDELERLQRKLRQQEKRIKELEDELFEITVLVPPVPGEGDAEVGFPEGSKWMKAEELKAISEALMERALLDAPMDHITAPQFEKPVIYSPKMYKGLMDTFLGREPEKKERKKKKKADNGTDTTQTT